MSAFMTRPEITLQGLQQPETPGEIMSRFAQLKAMGQQSQLAGQRIQGNQMELDEATAAKKDQELLQQVWMEKGGDEDATLAEAPRRGVRMQTVRALQAQRVKIKQDLLKMKDEEFKVLQEKTKFISSAIAPLTQIPEGPEGDAQLVQAAVKTLRGLVEQGAIEPQKAEKYDQLLQMPSAQIRQALQMLSLAGVSADKQFEAINKEKERTAGQKEFADFYAAYRESKGLPKNAKVEMEARTAYRQSLQALRQPVPGTDIPLPADVEAQRKRMNAARAEDARAEDASVEQTAGDYLREAKGDVNRALDLLNADEPKASAEFRRLAAPIRQRIRERARRVKPGKRDKLDEMLHGPAEANRRPNQ